MQACTLEVVSAVETQRHDQAVQYSTVQGLLKGQGEAAVSTPHTHVVDPHRTGTQCTLGLVPLDQRSGADLTRYTVHGLCGLTLHGRIPARRAIRSDHRHWASCLATSSSTLSLHVSYATLHPI